MEGHPKYGWDLWAYLSSVLNIKVPFRKLNFIPSYKTLKSWIHKHIPGDSFHWTKGYCIVFVNFKATSRAFYEEFFCFDDYAIVLASCDIKWALI
jgi:hypothetical protein